MRWLVTGASGMLGTDLCTVLAEHGEDVTGLSSTDLDIRDAEAVRAAARQHQVMVNAAGWTAVDEAEANEAGLHETVQVLTLVGSRVRAAPSSTAGGSD
jgi:dTDP-4-dehydrorhamnose reductase